MLFVPLHGESKQTIKKWWNKSSLAVMVAYQFYKLLRQTISVTHWAADIKQINGNWLDCNQDWQSIG